MGLRGKDKERLEAALTSCGWKTLPALADAGQHVEAYNRPYRSREPGFVCVESCGPLDTGAYLVSLPQTLA